jgi:hypothetical protein
MVASHRERIEGGSLLLLNLIMTTIQGGQHNSDMHHFFIREDYVTMTRVLTCLLIVSKTLEWKNVRPQSLTPQDLSHK